MTRGGNNDLFQSVEYFRPPSCNSSAGLSSGRDDMCRLPSFTMRKSSSLGKISLGRYLAEILKK